MLRETIGQILPQAVAAAISPFPVIGVVLMLVTPRARINAPAFVLGWIVGLAAVGAVGLGIAGAVGASGPDAASDGANIVQIVLGILLMLFALKQWRKRSKPGEEPKMPGWMDAVDHFTAPKAAGLGMLLSAVNPKNLLLALSAAFTIAATDLAGTDQTLAYTIFGILASLGVLAPVVLFFTMGDRARPLLDDLKTWLGHNNAAIMAVIFLVIGAKILGQGIAA